eukprot:TRINITY_DN8953_c0_g1_i1.p1 TRINITY_DN8953_c0_g1~~TRINITY_DN8953_c0_g1_i1.p1  ORF type:complete len:1043 (+),score=182.06 TRINITY_DN8953_c0_g1_i1:558-3686(+)
MNIASDDASSDSGLDIEDFGDSLLLSVLETVVRNYGIKQWIKEMPNAYFELFHNALMKSYKERTQFAKQINLYDGPDGIKQDKMIHTHWCNSLSDARHDIVETGSLVHEFYETARRYGEIIIRERYLPYYEKTIKPLSALTGIAGGEKYLERGIFFKFSQDVMINNTRKIYMYGGSKRSERLASKAMGHELKGLNELWKIVENDDTSLYNNFNLPLMCMINFVGFRICAISYVPITKKTLIYGTSDGGFNINISSGIKLNKLLDDMSHKLGVKPHLVKEYSTGELKLMKMVADFEIHRIVSKNGPPQYYSLDFARILPHNNPSSPFTCYFRNEFLYYQYNVYLSPDAFTGFGSSDKSHEQDHENAIAQLHNIIDNFSHNHDFVDAKKYMNYDINPGGIDIKSFLHKRGINLRFMGRIYSNFRHSLSASKYVKMTYTSLMCEMIVRGTKDALNSLCRKILKNNPIHLIYNINMVLTEFYHKYVGHENLECDLETWWEGTGYILLTKKYKMPCLHSIIKKKYGIEFKKSKKLWELFDRGRHDHHITYINRFAEMLEMYTGIGVGTRIMARPILKEIEYFKDSSQVKLLIDYFSYLGGHNRKIVHDIVSQSSNETLETVIPNISAYNSVILFSSTQIHTPKYIGSVFDKLDGVVAKNTFMQKVIDILVRLRYEVPHWLTTDMEPIFNKGYHKIMKLIGSHLTCYWDGDDCTMEKKNIKCLNFVRYSDVKFDAFLELLPEDSKYYLVDQLPKSIILEENIRSNNIIKYILKNSNRNQIKKLAIPANFIINKNSSNINTMINLIDLEWRNASLVNNVFNHLTKLQILNLSGSRLYSSEVFGNLLELNTLILQNTNLREIHGVAKLRKLQHLDLRRSNLIEDWDALKYLVNLEYLNIENTKISLDGTKFGNLKHLSLSSYGLMNRGYDYTDLNYLELDSLTIYNPRNLDFISNNFLRLESLTIYWGSFIRNIHQIQVLENLRYFSISKPTIADIEVLSALNLYELNIYECKRLKNIEPLRNINTLRILRLNGSTVQTIDCLKNYLLTE